jgi:hypothetical protein
MDLKRGIKNQARILNLFFFHKKSLATIMLEQARKWKILQRWTEKNCCVPQGVMIVFF